MFTDFPKIMVWHFHVPETQMSGMINFLHHRQNSRLIGFRDIKNHGIENLFFTVTIFNFLTRIAKFRCTIVLSEFQLNQCPDSLHGINRIRSFKSKPETFFLVETQFRSQEECCSDCLHETAKNSSKRTGREVLHRILPYIVFIAIDIYIKNKDILHALLQI